ncbi:hypothetical protein Purlil1_12831 [Purpureocillium lilacinum]|uniref:Uncharacterized protein n=1 Tax=Purpureocillium lilacinum TaxID=33203 RepID=A0ABR0BGE8_PURLI|nr:hypothetical protein Purlil1_12831 [Purpureocillium lilacinum]
MEGERMAVVCGSELLRSDTIPSANWSSGLLEHRVTDLPQDQRRQTQVTRQPSPQSHEHTERNDCYQYSGGPISRMLMGKLTRETELIPCCGYCVIAGAKHRGTHLLANFSQADGIVEISLPGSITGQTEDSDDICGDLFSVDVSRGVAGNSRRRRQQGDFIVDTAPHNRGDIPLTTESATSRRKPNQFVAANNVPTPFSIVSLRYCRCFTSLKMLGSLQRIVLHGESAQPGSKISAWQVQCKREFGSVFAKWLVNLALSLAIHGALWVYSNEKALAHNKEQEINVVLNALLICLSLSMASSLKHMFRGLRGWLLSLGFLPAREVDLISRSDHLSDLLQLTWTSRDLIVRSFIIAWLAVNLVAQLTIATITTTYNVRPAKDFVSTTRGLVLLPDMSSIYGLSYSRGPTSDLGALQFAANQHGMYAHALKYGTVKNIPAPGAVYTSRNAAMFCDEHSTSCSYIFHESAPAGWPGAASPDVWVATNRSVRSNTSCDRYRVSRGGDGLGHTITLSDTAGTEIRLPASNGPNQTLFMTTATGSGSTRWSLVDVFHASTTEAWYYRCNTSLGQVSNSQIEEHEVSDLVASFASAAIALQGNGLPSRPSNDVESPKQQFHIYPSESVYGISQVGDKDSMAKLLSRFAIGVIASVAQHTTVLTAPGLTPLRSVRLEVPSWEWVHIILGLVAAMQPLLATAAASIAFWGLRRKNLLQNRPGGISKAAWISRNRNRTA